jgi:predicted lipoprotein with Yx(FWY)xxD motif
MQLRSILAGATALVILSASAVFAEEFVGGAIQSAEVGGQTILTDANGMTLYTWDNDEEGVSNCYDQCAVNWPPLIAAEDAEPQGEFTLVERTDGTQMWAYEGMPLYLWIKDEKPGDTTGDGVGGTWHTAVID